MLKWFIDPAGNKVDIQKVLTTNIFQQYYPLSYLRLCAQTRTWTGTPSTTQLIKGSREAYLMLLTPYAIDPQKQAFRVLGVKAHEKLEMDIPIKCFSEVSIPNDEITGITDYLEPDNDGNYILVDYKTWGSNKIARDMGMVKKSRPMVDDKGQPVIYKRDGKYGKKGEQKKEFYYESKFDQYHSIQTELQLNRYRMVFEQYFNVNIKEMRLCIFVRDGNTQAAIRRGFENNIYYVPLKRMYDAVIKEYFERKRKVLLNAVSGYVSAFMEKNPRVAYSFCFESDKNDLSLLYRYAPSRCNEVENWEGNKCNKYCSVKDMCIDIGCVKW